MADKRYHVCCNASTDGAGVGYKLERVPAPPVPSNTFASMNSVEDLSTMVKMNPAAGLHNAATRTIIAHGKVRGDQRRIMEEGEFLSEPEFEIPVMSPPRPQSRIVKAQRVNKQKFTRGMEVKDVSVRRRGVIIQCSVGYTKKSRTPVHRVCDSNGDVWLAREDNLKSVY